MVRSLASLLIPTYLNMQQSVIPPGKIRKGCKEQNVCKEKNVLLGKVGLSFTLGRLTLERLIMKNGVILCRFFLGGGVFFVVCLFQVFYLTLSVFLLCFSVLVREVSYSLQAFVNLFGLPP